MGGGFVHGGCRQTQFGSAQKHRTSETACTYSIASSTSLFLARVATPSEDSTAARSGHSDRRPRPVIQSFFFFSETCLASSFTLLACSRHPLFSVKGHSFDSACPNMRECTLPSLSSTRKRCSRGWSAVSQAETLQVARVSSSGMPISTSPGRESSMHTKRWW